MKPIITALILVFTIIGCKEKEKGETFRISGYVKPDLRYPDSVLANQEMKISVRYSLLSMREGRTEWSQFTTDSNGYFTFSYKNKDYYEEKPEHLRPEVEYLTLWSIPHPDTIGPNDIGIREFQSLPPQCNFKDVDIFPRDTGATLLWQHCVD